MSIALFWWSRTFIYFFFIFLDFVINNVKPTCLESVNSNIYSWTLIRIIVKVTQNILVYELDVLHIFDTNIVFTYQIYRFTWFLISYWALRMLNFANSTLAYENLYFFISIKFDFEKKLVICRNFVAGQNFCGYINNSSFFSKSGSKYMWQGKISIF